MATTTTKTDRKILEFSRYPEGWRYGEGVPFKEETIIMALRLNATLLLYNDTAETDASPGADGSVLIAAACSDSDYWEFTVEPDDTITVSLEQNRDVVRYDEGIPFIAALRIAKNLYSQTILSSAQRRLEKVCFLSEYSGHKITFKLKEKNAFPAKRSRKLKGGIPRLEKSQVSQLLTESALDPKATQSAHTSKNFTAMSPESPSCFGKQIHQFYQKAIA